MGYTRNPKSESRISLPKVSSRTKAFDIRRPATRNQGAL